MSPLIYSIINFLILIGIVGLFGGKALSKAFKNQREELEKKIAEAQAQFFAVKKEYDRLKQLMDALEVEAAQMKRAAKEQTDFEVKRLEEESSRMMTKASKDAELRIKSELERAKLAIQHEVFDKALSATKENLRTELARKDSEWISQVSQTEMGMSAGRKNYAS